MTTRQRFPDSPHAHERDERIHHLIVKERRPTYGTGWLRYRYGRCYEISLAVFLSGRLPAGSALVHGNCLCLSGPSERTLPGETAGTLRFDHAWIQLPDGSIWDPVNCEVAEAEVWEELRRPDVWHTFTEPGAAEQAASGPLREDHTSPWCMACDELRPRCWRCGRSQSTTAELCGDCGAEVWLWCAECEKTTDPEARTCVHCGMPNPWAQSWEEDDEAA